MAEFEPDWERVLTAFWQPNVTGEPRIRQAITEYRRQEQEAGWVLVRKDDVRTLYNELDYSDAWIAAADRLEATLAATEKEGE